MPIGTPELMARCMKLWAPPAHYVLTEVRNGTGYSRREGYADLLAMSVWPSRGLEMIGAELKVNRSDWIREKNDPQKAEKFVQYCHRWYLVTANEAAKEEEIPKTWGWIVATEKGLKTVKPAPDLSPIAPDWLLLASIFRKIGGKTQGLVSQSELEKLSEEKAVSRIDLLRNQMEIESGRHKETSDKLRQLQIEIQSFCTATGVNLNTWRLNEQQFRDEALLYRQFREGGRDRFLKELSGVHSLASRITSQVSSILETANKGA